MELAPQSNPKGETKNPETNQKLAPPKPRKQGSRKDRRKSSNLKQISKILAGTAAEGFSGKVLHLCLRTKVKSAKSGRAHGKLEEVMGYPQMIKGTRENSGDKFIGNRAPQRVTITLNYAAYIRLERQSAVEGRSMSNLAAFILENALIKKSQGND